MLLKFEVSNFRSFNKLQEFSMFAGDSRNNPDHITKINNMHVLKNAVFYGANAGGKTSLISAMSISQEIILFGTRYPNEYREMYCRTDSKNKGIPSHFEYMFEYMGACYFYGFDIILSECKVVDEWLLTYDPIRDKEELIFNRAPSFELGTRFTDEESSRLRIYIDDLSEAHDLLFLTEMSKKNIKGDSNLFVFKEVFSWFENNLRINMLFTTGKSEYFNSGRLMDALGTDVTGFELVDLDDNESRNYDRILRDVENMLNRSESKELVFPGAYFRKEGNDIVVQEICTLHGSSDSHFHFEEESSGTFEVLKLLPILFMKGSDMTLIFDGYGSNMHTLMAYRFIQLFQKENEGLNNQLLVATHHTSLMSFDLFRRDEIWFVDKRCGESELYSLEEFDVRLDGKRLDKAYLEGRFGALPVFKDVS